jgi:predicted glutamine amidotransferase
MCIILLKPKGAILTEEKIKEAYEENPHGSGFVYYEPRGNKYKIFKRLDNEELLLKEYKEKVGDREKDLVVIWHSRIRSAGDISIENVQPFYLPNMGAMMAHNGTFIAPKFLDNKSKKSDTVQVADWIDNHLNPEFFEDEHRRDMLESYLGSSRVVFLFGETYYILNEDSGSWVDGIWQSKKEIKKKVYTGYTTYGYSYSQPKFSIEFLTKDGWVSKEKLEDKDNESETGVSLVPYGKRDHKDMIRRTNAHVVFLNYCFCCVAPLMSHLEVDEGICTSCLETIKTNKEDSGYY